MRWLVLCVLVGVGAVGCDESGLSPLDPAPPPDVQDDTDPASDVDSDPSDPPPPPVLRPMYDPEGEGFYRLPWPSDVRRLSNGSVDLSDFPQVTSNALVRKYRAAIENDVFGFSTMPVVYVAFADGDAPAERALLTPQESVAADASLQLIEVGPDGCGRQIPLETQVYRGTRDPYLRGGVMMSTPVPGFLLDPLTTYALVITTDFGSAAGQRSERAPAMDVLLVDDAPPAAWASHHDAFAPLRACWTQLGRDLEDVAVATVFTTDDPVRETRLLRQAVHDPQRSRAPEIREWESNAGGGESVKTWLGVYETPIFQRGNSPYLSTGGGLVFAEGDPLPLVQRWEEVPFTVSVPATGEGPFPVAIWSDGTGATRRSHLSSSVFRALIREGFAVVAFEAQFHGERSDRNSPGANTDLATFNYANPEAGRTNFRQQAADTFYFLRVLREALPGQEGLPPLDVSRFVYGGQSQGSLVGAMVAGVETEVTTYALNGVGAYLAITIVERKDPVDIAQLIRNLLRLDGDLTRFHPVVQLAQLGSDAVDPGNYARYWVGHDSHARGVNVLTVNGLLDDAVPARCADALTLSGDLAPIEAWAWTSWDPDPTGLWPTASVALPLAANRQARDGSPLTHVTWMDADQGHFTIFRVERAREAFVAFLTSGWAGEAAIPRR